MSATVGVNNQGLLAGLAVAAILWVLSKQNLTVKVGEGSVVTTAEPTPRTSIDPDEAARIAEFQVDGEPLLSPPLILALIQTESNFRIRAEGQAGEIGLMQIMPVTWTDTIKRARLKPDNINQTELDPYNARDNIMVGVAFLKLVIAELTQKLGRRPTIAEMLTAYNVGVAGFLKGRTNTVYVEKIRQRTADWVKYYQVEESRFLLPTSTNAINEL